LQACEATLRVIPPLGYIEFLALQKHATVVITDSGGIQEETTFLHIPCLTLRENTERPVTVSHGTNVLIGRDWDLLRKQFDHALTREPKSPNQIPFWDGRASGRIAEIIMGRESA
jgi:UDP-N-acetylglucosamine 2-epimerase (non-hydrolysing)